MYNQTAQNSKNYNLEFLDWDTKYFGVRSCRINLTSILTFDSQNELLKEITEYEFCTIVNNGNISENNYWIGYRTKAFLTDMNIQFSKKINDCLKINDDENMYVSNFYDFDNTIINISSLSFIYSRFFNDPFLNEKKAKNIYTHWVKSSFNKNNKYFVVYKENHITCGFLIFSIDKFKKQSRIELIAVNENCKGNGIGKSLINKMETYVLSMNINKINVGTQINNILAIEFYKNNNFRYVECSSIYHLWM